MNAREEAEAILGGRYSARVLEPSPPAIDGPPWFADDPVAIGDRDSRPVVSPIGNGDVRWHELAADDQRLAAWCAERWLGPYRRLEPLMASFTQTRLALHRLAEDVISPARAAVNGKIGLRWTHGGLGTPFFAVDRQLRVEGTELVSEAAGAESREPIDGVASEAAAQLADVFGFATSVLEELRAGAPAGLDPSRVQLWPEHFDVSVELGAEQAGIRATYGVSPGDEHHPEPYAYVAPWSARPSGPLWQAQGFSGAELPYAELLAAEDQRAAALAFFAARRDALLTG